MPGMSTSLERQLSHRYWNATCVDDTAATAVMLSAERLQELVTLKSVTVVSGTFSALGSLFLITTFHLTRTTRSVGFQIVYWLSVADFISSMIYVVEGQLPVDPRAAADNTCPDPVGCVLVGALKQFSLVAAIGWTCCIAINLKLTVLQQSGRQKKSPHQLIHSMLLGVWGSSLLSTLFLLVVGALGLAGPWCWIAPQHLWARLLFFHLPLLGVMVYSLRVYWRVRRVLLQLFGSVSSLSGDAGGAPGSPAAATPAAASLPSTPAPTPSVQGPVVSELSNRLQCAGGHSTARPCDLTGGASFAAGTSCWPSR